jgi:alkylated DNA repair protein (DNA oxidative demethylase)
MLDLFAPQIGMVPIAEGATLLRGFALDEAAFALAAVLAISDRAPFRYMTTPGGHRMSVAMTNCGTAGWVSDHAGYRYARHDPLTDRPWPPMPGLLADLARRAALSAGFADFAADVCLINLYVPGARMALHQDRDEGNLTAPIVSLSLGLPAMFLWGGLRRSDRPQRIALLHGDVAVWGGPARLAFHGIMPLKESVHAQSARQRYNLTFRQL